MYQAGPPARYRSLILILAGAAPVCKFTPVAAPVTLILGCEATAMDVASAKTRKTWRNLRRILLSTVSSSYSEEQL